jgi:hypothetical protein
MNKGYWHAGRPIALGETDPRRIELQVIISHAHRLRSRFMARKLRKWSRTLAALPSVSLKALGRYSRSVAQPWRLDGDRIAHGNRR